MADLVDLQAAHVTQYTNGSEKSAWKVRKNITSEDIAELPSNLSEKDVFACLDFARKFELIALNEGIQFQRTKQNQVYELKFQMLEKRNQELIEENARLASKLEQLIINKEA